MTQLIEQYLDELQEDSLNESSIAIPIPIPGWLKDIMATDEGLAVSAIILGAGALAALILKIYERTKFPMCEKKYEGSTVQKTIQKNMCIDKERISMYQTQITMLKKLLAKCSKSTNPQKCKNELTSKISKTQEKLEKAKRRYQQAKEYLSKPHWEFSV